MSFFPRRKPKLTYTTTDTTLPPPRYAHSTDACFDLPAAETVQLKGAPALVSTGYRFDIPSGYCLLLFLRSSTGKAGIDMSNCVGVIDEGYTGEVKAMLEYRHGIQNVEHGQYIVQAMLTPVTQARLVCGHVPLWGEAGFSVRGENGFGSTGT